MELFAVPNMKPVRFIFDYEGQYHVLKHFSEIDDKYFSELLKNGAHSMLDISQRIKKFGSKFHENFLSNPAAVIQLLEKGEEFVLHEQLISEIRIELQLVFDMARYPHGIGSDTLVRKNDFFGDSELKIRMCNGFPIHYVKGEPIHTWELHLIFIRSKENWRLITLFPGKYAPPFPDRGKHTAEEYELFSEFWNNHLFLTA